MQSKTSFFNKSIFLNTVKRFWPVWAAYGVVWIMLLPMSELVRNYRSDIFYDIRDLLEIAQTGGIALGVVSAVLSAMAVWSFMYNSKTMSGVACLPVRREGVFLSVTLAGIVPLVACNIVVCLLTAGVHLMRGCPGLVPYDFASLGIIVMMLVFFYGLATLCAQLTGNIITLPAVYAVLNMTAYVVEALVRLVFCSILIYGWPSGNSNVFSPWLSPIVGLFMGGPSLNVEYIAELADWRATGVYYADLWFLIVCAVAGLVMFFGAMALYRRRRMESVGDVVAVNVLKPVFKYCMTFGCALVSGGLFYEVLIASLSATARATALAILLFMLLGAVVGYFAAEMLIHKSFRVFRGRWRGLLVSGVVVCLLVLGVEFDLTGVEKRVPAVADVECVEVIASDHVTYYEPENIAAVTKIHTLAVENKSWHENAHCSGSSFIVRYHLKDGREFARDYFLRYDTGSGQGLAEVEALEDLQNSAEAISWRKGLNFEPELKDFGGGSLRGWVTPEEYRANGREDLSDEELAIIYYYGYDESYVRNEMTTEEKRQLAREISEQSEYDEKAVRDTNEGWDFTGEEMYELYTRCIVPDLAEGKLGKLWIITDSEYYASVCCARLSIDMWVEDSAVNNGGPAAAAVAETAESSYGKVRDAYTFTITPVLGSRTADWLTDHGVILHTVGEQNDFYGYETYDYGMYD